MEIGGVTPIKGNPSMYMFLRKKGTRVCGQHNSMVLTQGIAVPSKALKKVACSGVVSCQVGNIQLSLSDKVARGVGIPV